MKIERDQSRNANDEIAICSGGQILADLLYIVCSHISANYRPSLFRTWSSFNSRIIIPIYRSTLSTRGFRTMSTGDRVHENMHSSMDRILMEILC